MTFCHPEVLLEPSRDALWVLSTLPLLPERQHRQQKTVGHENKTEVSQALTLTEKERKNIDLEQFKHLRAHSPHWKARLSSSGNGASKNNSKGQRHEKKINKESGLWSHALSCLHRSDVPQIPTGCSSAQYTAVHTFLFRWIAPIPRIIICTANVLQIPVKQVNYPNFKYSILASVSLCNILSARSSWNTKNFILSFLHRQQAAEHWI